MRREPHVSVCLCGGGWGGVEGLPDTRLTITV